MTTPFTHGVASFDPTDRSVLLWTRLQGATTATWRLALDPGLSDVVASGDVTVGPDADGTAVVDVSGLEPGTTYFFVFSAAGAPSPVGRTRTLPGGDGAGLRLGLVSCARYSVAPLGVYRALAEREVDLVVHLGDYVYEDDGSTGPRRHDPARPAVTLDDYRRRIAQVRADPDCLALHLRHPMVLIVDDHDIADNCWSTGAKHHDEARDGAWDERVRAALRARQEWLPQRLTGPATPMRTWRSIPVGDLAEVVLLDTRVSGRDQHAGDEGTKPLDDPDRSLLGEEQRTWLHTRLADTSRPWAIVATGVVVNEISLPLPAPGVLGRLLPNGYTMVGDRLLHDDQWDGYPAERARLVDALAGRAAAGGRSVILSADVHASFAFHGPRDPGGRPVALEVTVPSVASKPMGRGHVPGTWRLLDLFVRRLEHATWSDVTRRGFALLDVAPSRVTAEWWFVEPTDAQPGSSAERACTLSTAHDEWPPSWTPAPPLPEPVRRVSAAPPPDRPSDLSRLRRRHRARLAFARALGASIIGAALAGGVRLGRRGRR